jgi:hypothetical protein
LAISGSIGSPRVLVQGLYLRDYLLQRTVLLPRYTANDAILSSEIVVKKDLVGVVLGKKVNKVSEYGRVNPIVLHPAVDSDRLPITSEPKPRIVPIDVYVILHI